MPAIAVVQTKYTLQAQRCFVDTASLASQPGYHRALHKGLSS